MPISVTPRRLRSGDVSDQLPYSKTAAHRAVRTTIGQELKARYEVRERCRTKCLTLLMQLNRAESSHPKR
jgi:hypothetical protein